MGTIHKALHIRFLKPRNGGHMKKKAALIATAAIVLMIIIGYCYVIHNQVRFDGDRVCSKNPNRFYLNFQNIFTSVVDEFVSRRRLFGKGV